MLQRVMIGAALLTEPRLILADEPTTALDVTTQAEVMAILDELRRERGLALLFITHDLELAERRLRPHDRHVRRARWSRRSPPRRLHDDPRHPYSAALVAARPRIDATAERLAAIPGRPLSAFEAPAGCAFATALPARPGPLPRDGTRSCGRRSAGAWCAASAPRRSTGPGGGPCLSAVVEVEGLRKEFGQLVAVDDVSLRVEAGRSLAIVGESGSGKTTVARMIIGLERPTAGVIRALGRDRSTPARSGAGAPHAAAPRCRSSSRTRTPASTRGRRFTDRSTRCCGCIAAARATSAAARVLELAELVGLDERQTRARSRAGCPAASASASRSPARWRPSRRC